jgi:hypothetical protein
VKTIGIIGMGGVGISTSWVFQQMGLNVIAFKKNKEEAEHFENSMKEEKIKVINKTNIKTLRASPVFKVPVSTSLQEIAEKADLILYCSLFQQNVSSYQFKEKQLELINKRNIPILAFPGKLGSSWLIGKGKVQVGLVGYSPVFVTRTTVESTKEVLFHINDFKLSIPLAYNNENQRLYLLYFLNRYFSMTKESPMFIDGGSTLKTSLSSPISTINASAICDNSTELIESNGKMIKTSIYALSEKYSRLFQKSFREQLSLAKFFELSNLPTIKNWLQNRPREIVSTNVTNMLHEIYKDKKIALNEQDRRITESFYALLFFKFFAKKLGVDVPATKQLLNELSDLHLKLNKTASIEKTALYIQESAVAYAKNILTTHKSTKKSLMYSTMNEN